MMTDTRFETPADEPAIIMTRIFDAPRELVWRAATEPRLFAEWWGPHGFTNTVHKMDVRPGGKWRIDQRGPDGAVYRFHGEYLEVEAPERLVETQVYADFPPQQVAITLDDLDGRTRLTGVIRSQSTADRDAMLKSGMPKGTSEAHDRLQDLLNTLGRTPAGEEVGRETQQPPF